jgi:transcriptional regulator with XRE-family HTH domain
MTLKQNLGKNIQKLRKERKMTQDQLAEKVGIDPKNISKIETGINYPTPETIEAIAKALNVEIYELFVLNPMPYSKMKEEIITAIENKNSLTYLYRCLKFES